MKKKDLKNWSLSRQKSALSYPPAHVPEPERASGHVAVRWGFSIMVGLWMFVLGVMVGRYSVPVNLAPDPLDEKLAALRAAEVRQDQAQLEVLSESMEKNELGFYDKLQRNRRTPPDRPKPAIPETPDIKRPLARKTDIAPEPADNSPASDPPLRTEADGEFVIQVASFKDAGDADRLVADLKEKGFSGSYRTSEDAMGSIWHRVKVGYFPDRPTAMKMLKKLHEQENLSDAYVVKRR